MSKILVINGHTGQGGSVANRIIIDTLKTLRADIEVVELAALARTDIETLP